MVISEFITQLNQWGQQRVPFLFLIDFELKKPEAWPLPDVKPEEVLFDINGFSNVEEQELPEQSDFSFRVDVSSHPIADYKIKFDKVMEHLNRGDTFLLNLTGKTKIEMNRSLKELFFGTKAKYKLWYKDRFLVFSPETFIQIKDQKIFSFPMKGTIDASLPNAKEVILFDEKELAEHVTIVDLVRNDLSVVAQSVKVNRFRYVEEVITNRQTLLQVSSEITGDLDKEYRQHIGSILFSLLPAGSISGAPKEKTVEIIREAEGEDRGFYTGVVGYFDGDNLEAGVMIRFIEADKEGLFYRSGGGITTQSSMESEYREVIQKIYAPLY